ncbi:unnamed protein product, partial [Ectocarpus sp. 6 AP-2014]
RRPREPLRGVGGGAGGGGERVLEGAGAVRPPQGGPEEVRGVPAAGVRVPGRGGRPGAGAEGGATVRGLRSDAGVLEEGDEATARAAAGVVVADGHGAAGVSGAERGVPATAQVRREDVEFLLGGWFPEDFSFLAGIDREKVWYE